MSEINYPRVWKTLLKMGFGSIFSSVRVSFFMTIAKNGAHTYTGQEKLDEIINDSRLVKSEPEMEHYIRKAINPNETFKHYYFESTTQQMMIEYFALTSCGIPDDYLEYVTGKPVNGTINGNCLSMCTKVDEKHINQNENSDEKSEASSLETLPSYSTHLIVIGENKGNIDATSYPSIIKHELTHACIYNLMKRIRDGYYKSHLIPSDWTDDEYKSWQEEIDYVYTVLNEDTEESNNFKEFICEFMMYESDGQQKVKNPVSETKSTKSDAKPKITYRTVTPFDRFQEVIDMYEDSYGELYGPILETLRPFYTNYDEFLDEIRM